MTQDQTKGWKFNRHAVECTGFGGTGGRTFDSMESIAREAAQNCLGARDDNSKPIKVEIIRKSIDRNSIPFISDFANHLEAAKELIVANPNTGNITDSEGEIDEAIRIANQDRISCLVIRDSNTVGLEGEHGQTQDRLFRFLAANGISQDVGESAGSHGLGKNSLIAGSKLGCFLFFSKTERHPRGFFSGRCDIGTHFNPYTEPDEAGDRETLSGVGYLVSEMQNRLGAVYPFVEELKLYPDELRTVGKGTCITIPGFCYDDEWLLSTVRAVVSGFNLAIYEEKIAFSISDEVTAESHDIFSSNLADVTDWCINDGISRGIEEYKNMSDVKRSRLGTSWGMTECFQPNNANNVFIFEEELEIIGHTKAVFYYDKGNTRLNNKYFILRRASMNICQKGSGVLRNFGGYIQCTSEQGNRIIKDLEDPTHTSFRDPSKIKNNQLTTDQYRRVNGILETFARDCLNRIKPRSDESGEIHDLNKFLPSQKGALQNHGNSTSEDPDTKTNDTPGVNIQNEQDMEWKQRETNASEPKMSYKVMTEELESKGRKEGAKKHKKTVSSAARPRDNTAEEDTGLPSPTDSKTEQGEQKITIDDVKYKLFKLPALEDSDIRQRIGVNIMPVKNGMLDITLTLAAEKTDISENDQGLSSLKTIIEASVNGKKLDVQGSTIRGIECIKGIRQMVEIDLAVSADYAFYLN